MAKSICEHIRNVKSSLENAEKSFRENNGMRGELDLKRKLSICGKNAAGFLFGPDSV